MKILDSVKKTVGSSNHIKAIDAHVHVDLAKEDIETNVKNFGVDPSFESLLSEMKKNNIERIVLISEEEEENIELMNMKIDHEKIFPIMYVDPFQSSSKEYMEVLEKRLKDGIFKGMKLFPGYEYFNPSEEKCVPIFKLAEKMKVPVMIHTGDTQGDPDLKPKVKYARPHYIDEVAVEFPNVKIIIAHAGNPWVHDAAEIAYKNHNVFLDVSGWFVGKLEKKSLGAMTHNLNFVLSFVAVDKVMYGSHWPLVQMADYMNFIKRTAKIDKTELQKLMYKNALKVFW